MILMETRFSKNLKVQMKSLGLYVLYTTCINYYLRNF